MKYWEKERERMYKEAKNVKQLTNGKFEDRKRAFAAKKLVREKDELDKVEARGYRIGGPGGIHGPKYF